MLREVTIEDQAMNAENLTFGDDRLGVVFYTRAVEDVEASKTEGRKVFREREYVKIMVPGDRHNTIDRPVQKTGVMPTDDRMRFAKQYERFKAQQDQSAHDGTPLALWPVVPMTLAEELKYLNIFTVEQLATLSDTHVAKIPGGHAWKKKAADFVAALKDQAQVAKLQSALEERDNRIDTLEKAVQDQAERIEKLLKKMEK
jgi:hypothetical protein